MRSNRGVGTSTDDSSVMTGVAVFRPQRMITPSKYAVQSFRMILQRKSMDWREGSLSGRPSEQTTGLPIWKRVLDLAFMLALSPALLILGAGVALLVRCGSRGPVLFRQRRVGYKGREFTCYKFRTMRVDAEAAPHRDHFRQLMESEVPMTKLDARKDPRLIPLGAAAARHRPG